VTGMSNKALASPPNHLIVLIHPNPTQDVLLIETNKNIRAIWLFAQDGQMIFTQNCTSKNAEIDLTNLSKGIYTLKIQSRKETVVKKVVKM
jgi:hypothetical protein